MIGRTNAGGGGLSARDAILRVIAPAGSTVTISKGGVSKSDAGHENASDHTLYDYYFIIHASQFDSVNPWTVTSTLGTQTISFTIVIDSADEYDMTISYTLWLIKDGKSQVGNFTSVGKILSSDASASKYAPPVTYGTTYVQAQTASSSGLGSGIVYYPTKIALSKYSKIHLIGSCYTDFSTMANNAFDIWTSIGTYIIDNRTMCSELRSSSNTSYTTLNKTIDISNYTSNSYLGFQMYKSASGSCGWRLTSWYLEV